MKLASRFGPLQCAQKTDASRQTLTIEGRGGQGLIKTDGQKTF